ncbi:MAG: ADP-ribosylglycohydrolase family protein [Desulfatitalea sp.]|nr:ADP-ribosylglycohydrolase family protein [Desulfatitalea sp.]NNJ99912.1 ADP-ribosylglycohydrolase family protein [Desulfatitalea sp.]
MIGAIAGDIIGSVYEAAPIKTKTFPLFHPTSRFTDDSVLTVAVALALLKDGDYRKWVRRVGRRHPDAGYGGAFSRWLQSKDPFPYNSWGNGAAMRVSPIGFAFDNEADVLQEAKRSAQISHDHPEGIKGAQAVALAVYLARTTQDKNVIRNALIERFGYNMVRTTECIRPTYRCDISCQGSVPEAIIAFLDADSWEDAVRNAISLGGDSDTLACIAGAVAQAYYRQIHPSLIARVKHYLTPDLWAITRRFCETYHI